MSVNSPKTQALIAIDDISWWYGVENDHLGVYSVMKRSERLSYAVHFYPNVLWCCILWTWPCFWAIFVNAVQCTYILLHVTVCSSPGGGGQHWWEDPEEGGGVCCQPTHHHGCGGRDPGPKRPQVRSGLHSFVNGTWVIFIRHHMEENRLKRRHYLNLSNKQHFVFCWEAFCDGVAWWIWPWS